MKKNTATLVVWTIYEVITTTIRNKPYLCLKVKGHSKKKVEENNLTYNDDSNVLTLYIEISDIPYIMTEQRKVIAKYIKNKQQELTTLANAYDTNVMLS